MNKSDQENMKIVDDILVKVFAGLVIVARAVRGTLDTTDPATEAKRANDLANAVVKPGK